MSSDIKLGVFTLAHGSTPLIVRENYALSEDDIEALSEIILGEKDIKECVILNTCNRVEIYVVFTQEQSMHRAIEHFCSYHDVEITYLKQYLVSKLGQDAVAHLFNVSSGLDSQVPGETEILGQVKQAYQYAADRKNTSRILNKVFQKSFQAAKWIRTNTNIGRGHISVGNIAADLSIRILEDLSKARILMIGTGDVGKQTLKAIHSRGGSSISIASRTLGRARLLAADYDGVAVDFEHIGQLIKYFDIIISATASTHPVLTHGKVKEAMRERCDEPLLLIDQAVPRDIEESVGQLSNVYLYNLEDLSHIANENIKTREAELSRCKLITEERASTAWTSLHESDESKKRQSL